MLKDKKSRWDSTFEIIKSPSKAQSQKAADPVPPVDINTLLKRMQEMLQEEIIDPAENIIKGTVAESYAHGAIFAGLQARRAGYRSGPFHPGSPVDLRIINNLRARSLSDLKGITDASSTQITRILSDGLLQGKTQGQVIREMVSVVDNVGVTRAATMVRTEVMRAVNTACRTKYDEIGVEKLQRLESLDERTCTDHEFRVGDRVFYGCVEIDGQIFTIDEAAEIDAQTHPRCRGTWIVYIETPADKGGD